MTPASGYRHVTLFQFTPLREGRPRMRCASCKQTLFQFTPLREGRQEQVYGYNDLQISIHAPPRGATALSAKRMSMSKFQFTPLREGRRRPGKHICSRFHFNSRPSARGDKRCKHPSTAFMGFQFTPLREGRRTKMNDNKNRVLFQFTPLREGRLASCSRVQSSHVHFNSRPSARGDCTADCGSRGTQNFNSRPSARGDASGTGANPGAEAFQFTPLREGRQARRKPSSRRKQFQFTPLREGRQDISSQTGAKGISIHAPPRGATVLYIAPLLYWLISIHAPPRGATAKDMQFLQIFCSTLTNQHGLTIMPRNLSRYFGNIS